MCAWIADCLVLLPVSGLTLLPTVPGTPTPSAPLQFIRLTATVAALSQVLHRGMRDRVLCISSTNGLGS